MHFTVTAHAARTNKLTNNMTYLFTRKQFSLSLVVRILIYEREPFQLELENLFVHIKFLKFNM